jgi:hypothetical protein
MTSSISNTVFGNAMNSISLIRPLLSNFTEAPLEPPKTDSKLLELSTGVFKTATAYLGKSVCELQLVLINSIKNKNFDMFTFTI